MRTAAALLLFFTVVATGASDDWQNLTRLHQGERIVVTKSDGTETKGDFTRSSADSISLSNGGTETTIERQKVVRVTQVSHAKRGRNVLIGVAIGLGVSLLIDRTAGVYLNNESGYSDGARAVTWIVPAAAFGALGAALPSHSVIYKAPRH